MTALAEVGPGTAAEAFFADVATHPAVLHAVPASAPATADTTPTEGVPAGRVAGALVPPSTTTAPPAAAPVLRSAPVGRPRVRLVPAPPPARPRTVVTPPAGPAPTLAERVRVLRADDHSLDLDMGDEDRGAPPDADPSLVVRRLASASVEVIAGRRPAAQLARWLAPGVLDVLRARAALTRHTATPAPARAPAVRGVRVCALHEHLVEATAVVDDGRRVRAIAVRLETHRGAWRATALEVG